MIPLSVLDLAPIVEGGDAADAFRNSVDLARRVERLGYRRFWLAEHHGMPGVASAATAVLIGHVAGATSTIRVGAGGIMLPNHSPLVVAEQFGTLATLYPGRIDLGLGRAPGSDPETARALRRSPAAADRFPEDVAELLAYFAAAPNGSGVQSVPGAGVDVPVWILGSSLFGARLAASLGLPFAFASHFAPAQLYDAIELYRDEFRPSARLDAPYVMVGVSVVAADTDAEARRAFTSVQLAFANLRRGRPGKLPRPVDDVESRLDAFDRYNLQQVLAFAIVGDEDAVRRGLARVVSETGADELMVASQVHDHAARVRSYEIAASARDALGAGEVPPRDVRDLLR